MKKFLALILALTLVASLFTVSVMAAEPTNHVATITADKTTELKAGDTVTVELKIDNNGNFTTCGYELVYDTDAFEIDTAKGQKVNFTTSIENCIDLDWYKGITDSNNSAWASIIDSQPDYNCDAEAGKIMFVWSGSYAINGDYSSFIEENFLIGKFKFTVKADVEDGEYDFALVDSVDKCYTLDDGLNTKGKLSATPLTVTVGDGSSAGGNDAPVFGKAEVDSESGVAIKGQDTVKYDNAYTVKATITPGNAKAIGVLFIPAKVAEKDTEWATAAKATLTGTAMGDGTVAMTYAIKGIPRKHAAGITMLAKAYAELADGSIVADDEHVVTTNVTFGDTGEVVE